MAMGSISISTCRALTQSVENAGGATPAVLRNLLAGYDDLAEQTVQPSDPARAVIDAYAAGKPDRAAELITAAAQMQHDADYRSGLRQRAEGMVVERFFKELCRARADEILDILRPRSTPPQKHSLPRPWWSTSTATRASSPKSAHPNSSTRGAPSAQP